MLNEKASLKSTAKAALYLLPMLVITITFNIWPIINSFLMSLYTKYDFYTDKVSAWGFDNFVYLWNDPDFHLAVWNTLVFVVDHLRFLQNRLFPAVCHQYCGDCDGLELDVPQ